VKFNIKGINHHVDIISKQTNKRLCQTITSWLGKFVNYCSEICTSALSEDESASAHQWDKQRDNHADDDTNPQYDEKRRDRQCVPRGQRICEANDSSRPTYRRPTYILLQRVYPV